MKILLALMLFPMSVFAEEMRSSKALTTQLKDQVFTAELKPGHHFNDKAPNGIQIGDQLLKPAAFDKQKIVINAIPANLSGAVAHLYVCDDAVTYCEVHSINLGEAGQKALAPSKKSGKLEYDSHGFIVNNFEAALQIAQKQKKNLIIDFGARWCPACVRLDQEIFSNKEFKDKAKNLVKVKIDVDVFQNAPLLQKYSIKGFPTILFTDAQGIEITRFLDYQPMSFIANMINEVNTYPVSLAALEQVLWKRYLAQDKKEEALKLAESFTVKPKEYLVTKINVSHELLEKKPETKDQFIKDLRSAIQAEPNSSMAVSWRAKLIEQLPEKSKDREKILQEGNQQVTKMLSDPEYLKQALANDSVGEFTGLERFYVALLNADLYESAGMDAQGAYELIIAEGKKANIGAKQPGAALRLGSILFQAKKYDEALALSAEMLKAKPNDGDLQRRRARLMLEVKRYDEAVQLGEKALKNSYGINEFYVVEPLAKSYMGLNQNQKAKELVKTYLARNEINFKNMQSFKKKLEALDKELSTVK